MGVQTPLIAGMGVFEPMLLAEHRVAAPTATQAVVEEFAEFGLGQGVLMEGVLIYGMFLRGLVLDTAPAGVDNKVEVGLMFDPAVASPITTDALLAAQNGVFAHIAVRTELTTSGMAALGGPAYRWEPPEAILLRRNPSVFNFQDLATTQIAVVAVYYKRVTLDLATFNALITRT